MMIIITLWKLWITRLDVAMYLELLGLKVGTVKMTVWVNCGERVENNVVFHCGKCGRVFHT